jgi:hypothetical protein
MSTSPIRDPKGSLNHLAGGGGTAVAAGAGDATEVNGTDINRIDFEGGYFLISARATLAAGKKLAITATIQHAPDNGSGAAGAYADVPSDVATADQVVTMTPTLTDGGAGSTLRAVGRVLIKDLSQLKEWIRIQVTPDLDAGATDTCEWTAIFVGAPVVAPGSLIGGTT